MDWLNVLNVNSILMRVVCGENNSTILLLLSSENNSSKVIFIIY